MSVLAVVREDGFCDVSSQVVLARGGAVERVGAGEAVATGIVGEGGGEVQLNGVSPRYLT